MSAVTHRQKKWKVEILWKFPCNYARRISDSDNANEYVVLVLCYFQAYHVRYTSISFFFPSHLFYSPFFFSLPPMININIDSRNSDPRGHVTQQALLPPYPPRFVPFAVLSLQDFRPFFYRRLASNCAYSRWALSAAAPLYFKQPIANNEEREKEWAGDKSHPFHACKNLGAVTSCLFPAEGYLRRCYEQMSRDRCLTCARQRAIYALNGATRREKEGRFVHKNAVIHELPTIMRSSGFGVCRLHNAHLWRGMPLQNA